VLDELDSLNIEFISAKEGIDTSSEAGRMFMNACHTISALERSLGGEKIRQGMRRAEYEGQRLGRAPLDVDHAALVRDRIAGMSLSAVAKKYGISRASVVRFVWEEQRRQLGTVDGFTVRRQHARYYWLMLAEGYLTRVRLQAMLRRIAMLPLPAS
jgi:DNA invertase Pin-like site-specific DNA recombinase